MGRGATDTTADGKIELQRLSRETSGEMRRGCKGDEDLLTPSRVNAVMMEVPGNAFSTLGLGSGSSNTISCQSQ